MKRARRHLWRVFGFAVLPACSLLAPLVLLPLISDRFGPGAWSTVAIGQSTGAIASVVVGLTWSIEGGNLIARSAADERGRIFLRAVMSQLIVLLGAGLVTALITALIAPEYKLEAVLFALGTTMNGLTASWYYSGTGKALPLVVNEGLMRLLGYVVALVGILLGAGLLWYAAVTVAAGVAMFIANWVTVVVLPKVRLPRGLLAEGWRTVRSESFGTAARLVQSVYTFGGPSLYSILSPVGLANYAGARTVMTTAANGLSAIPNAFVSYVGGGPEEERQARIRRTQTGMFLFAILVFGVGVALGPLVLEYLFAGKLDLPFLDLVLLAGSIAATFYNRTYQRLVLVPLGRAPLVYKSTMSSSIVGLGLYVVLIPLFAVPGALVVPGLVALGLQVWYRIALRRPAPVDVPADVAEVRPERVRRP